MASRSKRRVGKLSASRSVIGQFLRKTPITHGAFDVNLSEARYFRSVVFHTLSVHRCIDGIVPIRGAFHSTLQRKKNSAHK